LFVNMLLVSSYIMEARRHHWPCNIDITKNRFYMAARIDSIVILILAATDLVINDHKLVGSMG